MRMTRIAGLALAAATVLQVAGCGLASGPEGERGGTLVVVARNDVESLDPGVAYARFPYMIIHATQRTLYSYRPDRPDAGLAGPRGGDPRDLRRQSDRGGPTQGRRPLQPARRSPRHVAATSSTRSTAGSCPASTTPPPACTSATSRGSTPSAAAPRRTSPASGPRTTGRRVPPAPLRPDGCWPRRSCCRCPRRCRAEYARRFDRADPVDLRSPSGGDGSVHGPGRPDRAARRPYAGAADRARPQPELERRRRHPAGVPGRDRRARGNTDPVAASRSVLAGTGQINGDSVTPAPVLRAALASGRDQVELPPAAPCATSRSTRASRRSTTPTSAAPWRPRSIARRCAPARRPAHRRGRHPLHPAGRARLRGGRRRRRSRASTSSARPGRHGARDGLHAARRVPSGRYGGLRPLSMVGAADPADAANARLVRRRLRASGSAPGCGSSRRRRVRALVRAPGGTRRGLPRASPGRRTSTTPRRCCPHRSGGRASVRSGNTNWPLLDVPGVNAAIGARDPDRRQPGPGRRWAKVDRPGDRARPRRCRGSSSTIPCSARRTSRAW